MKSVPHQAARVQRQEDRARMGTKMRSPMKHRLKRTLKDGGRRQEGERELISGRMNRNAKEKKMTLTQETVRNL